MLGNGRLEANCFDGKTRLCHIRGALRKKVCYCLFGSLILDFFFMFEYCHKTIDMDCDTRYHLGWSAQFPSIYLLSFFCFVCLTDLFKQFVFVFSF